MLPYKAKEENINQLLLEIFVSLLLLIIFLVLSTMKEGMKEMYYLELWLTLEPREEVAEEKDNFAFCNHVGQFSNIAKAKSVRFHLGNGSEKLKEWIVLHYQLELWCFS